MNQNHTFFVSDKHKIYFLVCCRILVISLCVPWDAEGWKSLHQGSLGMRLGRAWQNSRWAPWPQLRPPPGRGRMDSHLSRPPGDRSTGMQLPRVASGQALFISPFARLFSCLFCVRWWSFGVAGKSSWGTTHNVSWPPSTGSPRDAVNSEDCMPGLGLHTSRLWVSLIKWPLHLHCASLRRLLPSV